MLERFIVNEMLRIGFLKLMNVLSWLIVRPYVKGEFKTLLFL